MIDVTNSHYKKIIYKKKLLALIVRGKYRKKKGITFFTPSSSTQQFGYMKHKKKHIIIRIPRYVLFNLILF